MRKNQKNIGLLIIALGLVIIAIVVYLVFFNKPAQDPEIIPDTPSGPAGELPATGDNAGSENITEGDKPREKEYNPQKEEPHVSNENDAAKLARGFVERFGSFSNYSNYSNFEDLKIFMTPKMKTWAKTYVDELKSSASGSDEYYGVTTKAISTKVKSYDKNKALILVKTQRIESGAMINEGDAYTQDIEVSLENINGSWLVDSAFWQEK